MPGPEARLKKGASGFAAGSGGRSGLCAEMQRAARLTRARAQEPPAGAGGLRCSGRARGHRRARAAPGRRRGSSEEAGLSEGGGASARAALKPASAGRAPPEAPQPSAEPSIPSPPPALRRWWLHPPLCKCHCCPARRPRPRRAGPRTGRGARGGGGRPALPQCLDGDGRAGTGWRGSPVEGGARRAGMLRPGTLAPRVPAPSRGGARGEWCRGQDAERRRSSSWSAPGAALKRPDAPAVSRAVH